MDYGKLPWMASAVVLWLPKGEQPDEAKHFNVEVKLDPPHPNPEAWWDLGQAVISVRTAHETHGKEPWIKVGEQILPPNEILGAYEFLKHHGHGDA
jgi:hypothetical protein